MLPLRARGAWVAQISVVAPLLLLLPGCGHKVQISDLAEEYTYTALSFSPSAATAAGLHEYKDQKLDWLLDDMGPAAMDQQTRFYQGFSQRLKRFDPHKLNAQDRADFVNLQNAVGLALFDLVEARDYLHDPLRYTQILGNALYTPYILEYAPKIERFRHIASRLREVPLFLDQATTNITSAPSVWTKAAIAENQGVINMVDGELRAAVPTEVAKDYADAASVALPALAKFQEYLQDKLQYLDNADWRLGSELYAKKFHYVLESGGLPEDLVEAAEGELLAVRARMFGLALPMHRALFPAHKDHPELEGWEQQRQIIREVLYSIGSRHSTPQSFMDDVRRDIEEARAFVQQKHLLAPAAGGALQVMPTPEFLRAIDANGGFQPSPALEPQLNAFYWITPIPPDLPREQAEAKLREYNFYRLKLLALRTAVPGRYSQMEAANAVQPKPRRLLRSVFGAHAYIQGWAEYVTQTVLVNEGYPENTPEMALALAKEQLRTLADTILDVRLHMFNMTDEDALNLLENDAFQEPEEAAEKLRSAKLTSCEGPGYFVGAANWIKARDQYQASRGGSPVDFRNRALKQGAVPMSSLISLLIP